MPLSRCGNKKKRGTKWEAQDAKEIKEDHRQGNLSLLSQQCCYSLNKLILMTAGKGALELGTLPAKVGEIEKNQFKSIKCYYLN